MKPFGRVVSEMDCFRYKETMQGLILKDMQALLVALEQ